ncbi:response regulator [Candidatus Riflebacteria bacterium]
MVDAKKKDKILTIEDDPVVRESIIAFLEDCGYSLIQAESGELGLELFRKEQPTLILLDLRIPGKNGLEVLATVKKESPDTPVIIISGTGRLEDVVQTIKLGASDYLTKPIYDMVLLEHAVEKALQQHHLILKEREYHKHLENEVEKRTSELSKELMQRKLTEKKLIESQERFDLAVRATKDGIWDWNILTDDEYYSPQWYEIIGYSPAERERLNNHDAWASRIHPDDYQRVADALKAHLEQGRVYDIDYRHRHKSGEYRWQNSRGQAIFDKSGMPVRMVGSIRDINERKKAEKAFHTLLGSTAGHTGQELFDIIVNKLCELFDCDCAILGEVVDNNTIKALAMQLDDRKVSDFTYKLAASPCENVIEKGYCFYPEGICELFPEDKELIDLHAVGYVGIPLRGNKKQPIGVLCAISRNKLKLSDYTEALMNIFEARAVSEIERQQTELERIKLEGQLYQAQRMEGMGTLAGGIAHDFNNILVAILGYAEMVYEQLEDGSELQAFQGEVITAVDRAKELIKQILAFSRQVESEHQPIQIQLIVKEALKLLRSSIPSTIEIQQDIEPGCGPVLADPTQIHQVILNLCTNAYQAMREKGGILGITLTTVNFTAGDAIVTALKLAPGSYIRLEVSDTGPGMDRAIRERIFEPYFTTREKDKGTGLGLAVVLGIVKSHAGEITVYSQLGKGTTFNVYFPKLEMEIPAAEAMIPEQIPGGNERILVVDDQEEISNILKQILESLGYQVTDFSRSNKALEAFLKDPENFDLIITDMTMPDVTGAELAQRILKERPGLPIILCTGFSELIDREKAIAIGISEFVMKPVIKRDLAKMIRKLLDEK